MECSVNRHDQPVLANGRRRRDESGAAMVEFALVVGLFAFILYGLVSFGSVLATKQRVTSAAADGARASVGALTMSGAGGAADLARRRVETKLGLPGTTYSATYLEYLDSLGCATADKCIQVTIVYNLPASPGLGLVTPPTTTSNAVVQWK